MVRDQDAHLMTKRLDAIINILLETARPDGKEITVKEKVRILDNAGLRPIEIARILGISITHVSVDLHELRKSKKLRAETK